MSLTPLFDRTVGAKAAAIGSAAFILGLREQGVRDTDLLRAMEQMPREVFAPNRFRDLARSDMALPLPCGQTMTAPGTVAKMLASLEVREGQRVLEIGTGSGYVTALLARLGCSVVTVEQYAPLTAAAREHVRIVGLAASVTFEVGDGLTRRLRGVHFDRVILNGALPEIPETVTTLIPSGGRVVGAVATTGLPRLVGIERLMDKQLRYEQGLPLRLTKLTSFVVNHDGNSGEIAHQE